MQPNTLIQYAIQSGKIVHINDVESGLRCNCRCPVCKSPLVAKKGEIKSHHFAHSHDNDCETFGETMLHLIGKEILIRNNQIRLPGLFYKLNNYSNQMVTLSAERTVEYISAEAERKVSTFQPDVILDFGKKQLFVEIAVTHFTKEDKKLKIKEQGTAAIEVDLSDLLLSGYSYSEVEETVLLATSKKKWLFNPKHEQLVTEYLRKEEIEKEGSAKRDTALIKKEEANLKLLLKEARIRKFNTLKVDEYGSFMCPMKINEQSRSSRSTWFTDLLKKGGTWNGQVYGKGSQGRYVFIDNTKQIIFAPDHVRLNDDDYEKKTSKYVYGQAMNLSRKCRVELRTCKACDHFMDEVGNNYEIVLCNYKRQ